MTNNEISNVVLFKRGDGDKFEFDDKFVRLKALDEDMFVFTVNAPQEIVGKSMIFFEGLKMFEPVKVDIGGTGDIPCYFKGVSPIVNKGSNGLGNNAFFTITLQELKNPPKFEEEHECVNCGFHNFTA
ncbi:hypothetical protein [Methanobrevibacter boviskoreani]|jgi:hypothetical protein|uniref:hypothetical protein n=1 Tax=Methanobrevibacter boviskoreani TaxID=1348249 RepID=UPI0023A8D27C|nr:hypothetical protein [Methanobrevibacter boviskoreani]MCI6774914.1 hypothetical protein [Methanobrevibacter boviskoreani]MCI6931453.1 hypothetical protein [Methanobrevibacter boviskoreani]MDD6257345.1 hypothetical protein [Methanobrevibacter boviskoreani]MDY5613791.1 hypothetical protein [Methanobrevibacter boviskoreani]